MNALVLLHGWGMNPGAFDVLRPYLAAGCDVHAPALGCDSACTLQTLADSVASVSPQLCDVVGWSLGGQVALAWALRCPEQVRRIVLVATTPRFVQVDGWRCGLPAEVFAAFAAGLRSDAGATLTRFVSLQAQGDERARRVIRELRVSLERGTGTAPEILDRTLSVLRTTDLRAELAAIGHDTLVIHGERDALVPIAAAEYLAAALPHARRAFVPDAGHAPFVSFPQHVARSIQAFLA